MGTRSALSERFQAAGKAFSRDVSYVDKESSDNVGHRYCRRMPFLEDDHLHGVSRPPVYAEIADDIDS